MSATTSALISLVSFTSPTTLSTGTITLAALAKAKSCKTTKPTIWTSNAWWILRQAFTVPRSWAPRPRSQSQIRSRARNTTRK
ncbi:hypothetical protein BDR26DRAFT_859652 [Obelidium mucronatum]|nr:hypothetical protein BDR26DRAFT_859652 [Obelidium mucronatum]